MPDTTRIREQLRTFDFDKLFVEELGWDRHTSHLDVQVDSESFALHAVAQKRGMVAYVCDPLADGSPPDYATRRKVERQVSRSVLEHLIVYVDQERTAQVWQWVKREPGKPTACREHQYRRNQPGDALIQKLQAIAFSLAEEESLSLVEVTRRTRKAFDVERVTRRFYDEFRKQHIAFLKFITGIPIKEDREWYASVMLNRLMFIYFIQRKGFLDRHRDYLRDRLIRTKKEFGKDKFYSFYRYFLLRLFHEGLGGTERTPELQKLLGRIPYLNGGLFDIHELERPDRYGKAIDIPDEAFETIFDYFDRWHWHLDERPLRADNEINPGVLGYIFEKYINQKQMGAYYTEEDITGYISKNTVIPFLFDAARTKCKIAFENPNGPTIWDLLKAGPERYIYPAVLHGNDKPLPADIAAGLNDVSRRMNWNKPAAGEFALPTEIWREVAARRKRCEELQAKLAGGKVRDINDLITLNLNIRQFAQDVIESCEGPDLLRALWHAIIQVTILDPTCGSGAFLFAALNVLEPLYEACLDRMEAFVADLDSSNEKHRLEKFSDFRKVLEDVAAHPNRRYYIFKSIILNNLFGVDIMEEAVEICKLRLFLKLAAQVEPDAAKDNLGIEPLPDIDFNIRAGNTLVGYATADEVRRTFKEDLAGAQIQGKFLLGESSDAYQRFEKRIELADRAFEQFRAMQTEHGIDANEFVSAKQTLRERLKALQEELNRSLANEYRVKAPSRSGKGIKDGGDAYTTWLKSHQPFHWFVEFYGIVSSGGFDVIIGNPPYVVNSPEKVAYKLKEELFRTFSCKNLYAFVFERSDQLAHKKSSLGLIVQLTVLSSEKMSPLQDLLLNRGLLVAPAFPRRPESIFNGVEMPVTILVSRPQAPATFTSRVSRFYTAERPHALYVMTLAKHSARLHGHRIGKLGTELEVNIVAKLNKPVQQLDSLTTGLSDHVLYYQEACRYWVKACKGFPFFRRNGKRMPPPHGRTLFFKSLEACAFASCLLNSTLFYWFYSVFSDCEHINDALIRSFKITDSWCNEDWSALENRLADGLTKNAQRKTISTKQGHKIEYDELDASKSKEIIDEIDRVLAAHYGFTDEELDFIINYDIKYRMGRDAESEEE
jgi:hypothetical protein